MTNIIALNCAYVNKKIEKHTIFMIVERISKKLQIVIFAFFTKMLTKYIRQLLHKIHNMGVYGRFHTLDLCKVNKLIDLKLFDNTKNMGIIHFAIG
jgi:hypothetical protein